MTYATKNQILQVATKYQSVGRDYRGQMYAVAADGKKVKFNAYLYIDSLHNLAIEGKMTYNEEDWTYSAK